MKYRITSGEFILILKDQGTPLETALFAIQLHIESQHHTELGQITTLTQYNSRKKDTIFDFSTDDLIEQLLSDEKVSLIDFI